MTLRRTGLAFVMAIALEGLLGGLLAWPQEATAPNSLRGPAPLGLDLAVPLPPENEPNPTKVELGRRLFFDAALSRDDSMACATCHDPVRYFTNGQPRGTGVGGQQGRRNVPSVLNVGYGRAFFWDGRAPSLEDQVLLPIQNPAELDLTLEELELRLEANEEYRIAFLDSFEDGKASAANAARALASYLRTLRAGDAPIDRHLAGDTNALGEAALRGMRVFTGQGNCSECHPFPLFTDHRLHNTGVSYGAGDAGRYAVTGQEADRGRFKTPSLRNVAQTAPYMHDGSLASLEEVVEHYDSGGAHNPHLDPQITPLGLTDTQKADLIAFLQALTSCTVNEIPIIAC